MAIEGFLGTKASFLSDLLLISLVVLIPAFTVGYILARRHSGAVHRVVMLATYGIIVVFVIVYIIHNLVDGFPPLRGETLSTFNIVYFFIGLAHSALATAALILGGRQLFSGYKFSSQTGQWSMRASDRAVHGNAGKGTLIVFASTAVTGIIFYAWVFANQFGG